MPVIWLAAAQHIKVVSWLLTGSHNCPEWFCRRTVMETGMVGAVIIWLFYRENLAGNITWAVRADPQSWCRVKECRLYAVD